MEIDAKKQGSESRKQRREEEKREWKEPKSRLVFFVCVLFFALTLKDTSLLMSQKALNNTTDQYISPLMGFSMEAVLAQSPVHAQTHEKRTKTHPSAHTHQCTMWHMAASSTAERVKRNMEQWKWYT